MKAVVMAGGRGTRMKPYSYVMPKPMLPVGKYPVLEIAIHYLAKNGFNDIIVSTGYMGDMISGYFGNGSKYGASIEYAIEKTRLGTVGALGLIRDKLTETFLVMNGDDVLVPMDFRALTKLHKDSKAVATAVIRKEKTTIEWGVIDLDKDGAIMDWKEKPTVESNITVGMYMMEPEAVKYIKPNEKIDMPQLIMRLIAEGKKVQTYVHDGKWLHLNREADFISANENWKELIKELKLDDVLDTLDSNA